MDVGNARAAISDAKIREALANIAAGAESKTRRGLAFLMQGESGFGSFRKMGEREVVFREYDEMGRAFINGSVEFSRENGTIGFTLEVKGDQQAKIEGWLAIEKQDGGMVVYFPWRLASDEGRRVLLAKVLGGYEHLKEGRWSLGEFEHKGVGLSGEEEGKVWIGVDKWGKV